MRKRRLVEPMADVHSSAYYRLCHLERLQQLGFADKFLVWAAREPAPPQPREALFWNACVQVLEGYFGVKLDSQKKRADKTLLITTKPLVTVLVIINTELQKKQANSSYSTYVRVHAQDIVDELSRRGFIEPTAPICMLTETLKRLPIAMCELINSYCRQSRVEAVIEAARQERLAYDIPHDSAQRPPHIGGSSAARQKCEELAKEGGRWRSFLRESEDPERNTHLHTLHCVHPDVTMMIDETEECNRVFGFELDEEHLTNTEILILSPDHPNYTTPIISFDAILHRLPNLRYLEFTLLVSPDEDEQKRGETAFYRRAYYEPNVASCAPLSTTDKGWHWYRDDCACCPPSLQLATSLATPCVIELV